MPEIGELVGAIRAGGLAVLPTDTVYGLACVAADERAVADLYRLKGRAKAQPTALLAASVDALVACIPELDDRSVEIARALLPGPYTLVVANPARRFGWLSPSRPETLGVRVPVLTGAVAELIADLAAVAATSANLAGGADPRRLDEVDPAILAGVVVALDGGELPGTPSTVIDLTGVEPVVLRHGAVDPAPALALIADRQTEPLPSDDGLLTAEE